MSNNQEPELPPSKTNWLRVYVLILAWMLVFILLMYAFSQFTA
jgi:hypothetical protein